MRASGSAPWPPIPNGVIVNDDIAERFRESGFDIGQTWGGHPVSCAAGVAAIDAYADGLLDNVRALAPTLERQLKTLEEEHEVVGDVRGRGSSGRSS